MKDTNVNPVVFPLISVSVIAVLGVIGHIAENRRLKREGKDLRMQSEALKINRATKKWMTTAATKLDPADFTDQLNERIDFAIFIANH